HLSAYCLTIEEKTVFGNWAKKGFLSPATDEYSAQQFEILLDVTGQNGYEQYEISNFCRNNKYSKHNSSYWKGIPYLGIGPGAHSYNGMARKRNISNNPVYIREINQGKVPAEIETLSISEQINDYILTSIRTKWGCSISHLRKQFNF